MLLAMTCPRWLKIPILTISPLEISTTLLNLTAGTFDSLHDAASKAASVALAAPASYLEGPASNTTPYPHHTADRQSLSRVPHHASVITQNPIPPLYSALCGVLPLSQRRIKKSNYLSIASSAAIIREHRSELRYLRDLISWHLKLCSAEASKWTEDNSYARFWSRLCSWFGSSELLWFG
jgi:hypothetical protein